MELIIAGMTVCIDDEDYNKVNLYKWFLRKAKVSRGLYYFYANGVDTSITPHRHISIALHRYIVGCTPNDGIVIDHKDRNTLNNRKSNLRKTSPQGNCCNRAVSKNNTTGYKGVGKDGLRYRARIAYMNKNMHICTSGDAQECAHMYDMIAIRLHGDMACTNFDIHTYTDEQIEGAWNKFEKELRATNTSGHKGVFFDTRKNGWVARITVNKKQYYFGKYTTIEAAIEAYTLGICNTPILSSIDRK